MQTGNSDGNVNIGRAVTSYLADLPPEQRDTAAPELHRMMRWFGGERNLASISVNDLERYQQQISDSGVDPTQRLQPVKEFFAYAGKKKLTTQNLSPHVRVRRKTTSRSGGVTRKVEAPTVDMTREGREQLLRELHRLENEVAPAVRVDLKSAYADKDFRENAPYEAAKLRLGEIQGRINELKATLSAANIVEPTASTDRVALGSTVTVRDLEDDEELKYTLVGPGEVDARSGRISLGSPIGKALKDRVPGDEVIVETPGGSTRFRIESIARS